MRGDRPAVRGNPGAVTTFTPHARGSTLLLCAWSKLLMVYPACAGIDPVNSARAHGDERLPRMRGDRPTTFALLVYCLMFTPHARGSTRVRQRKRWRGLVYPACAGIDRSPAGAGDVQGSLPRMRGDRPE